MRKIAVVLWGADKSSEITDVILTILSNNSCVCQVVTSAEQLSQLSAQNFDGLVFPDSTGNVDKDVKRVIEEFHECSNPILAMNLAPLLLAKVLGSKKITVTTGNDKEKAAEVQKTGAIHANCKVTDFITDREHKIITTPAYMYDEATPGEVFTGISKAVKEFVEMA